MPTVKGSLRKVVHGGDLREVVHGGDLKVAIDCAQPALPVCYRETERNVISNTCCQWQTAWPANLPRQLVLTLSMEGHRLYVNRLAS
jgi:hypothetical protein